MEDLIRTNDPTLISFVQVLLRDAGITPLLFDQNASIVEGSIGIIPRRLLVPSEDAPQARRILTDAGLAAELHQHD